MLPAGRVTPEEYLAFDRASEIAHEYVNGEIRAMTGASREHGLIQGDLRAGVPGRVTGGASHMQEVQWPNA